MHRSVAGSSTWMLATIAGMSAGMLTFGWILDRIGPRFAFGLFLIASAAGVYILTLPNSMGALKLLCCTSSSANLNFDAF